MPNPFLSVIIPAFNEEQRLPRTLAQVLSFLQTQAYPSEILVIENASHDRTFQVADVFATQHHSQQLPIKVLREPVQGKGAAVKRGVFLARGEYHFMCDADLSMPVEEINRFLPPILDEFESLF